MDFGLIFTACVLSMLVGVAIGQAGKFYVERQRRAVRHEDDLSILVWDCAELLHRSKQESYIDTGECLDILHYVVRTWPELNSYEPLAVDEEA